jgi:hypothetical protein
LVDVGYDGVGTALVAEVELVKPLFDFHNNG